MEFLYVLSSLRIRQIECENPLIAIEFVRDLAFTARIVETTPHGEGPVAPPKWAA
jgi:hypothetical protein